MQATQCCKPRHSLFRAAKRERPTMPSLLEGLAGGEGSGLPLALLVPLGLLASLLFFLRPRKAGRKDAPPLITSSPVSSVPLLGPAIEFGKSPVKMVRRCYDDYGPVFTVPVRFVGDVMFDDGAGCVEGVALATSRAGICCVVTSCRVPCVLFAGEQLHWPSERTTISHCSSFVQAGHMPQSCKPMHRYTDSYT